MKVAIYAIEFAPDNEQAGAYRLLPGVRQLPEAHARELEVRNS